MNAFIRWVNHMLVARRKRVKAANEKLFLQYITSERERVLETARRKRAKVAKQKEAQAQRAARELEKKRKLGVLPEPVADNFIYYDADQLIMEDMFHASPSE